MGGSVIGLLSGFSESVAAIVAVVAGGLESPLIAALVSACWRLRRNRKTLPSLAVNHDLTGPLGFISTRRERKRGVER